MLWAGLDWTALPGGIDCLLVAAAVEMARVSTTSAGLLTRQNYLATQASYVIFNKNVPQLDATSPHSHHVCVETILASEVTNCGFRKWKRHAMNVERILRE